MGNLTALRAAAQFLSRFQMRATMFKGKRDFYKALGYADSLTFEDYLDRYERGDIASRIVDAYPEDTWRAGAEILEVEDPDIITEFEAAAADLMERTNLWAQFLRADILAGIGEYAVLFIGAPGNFDEELPRGVPGGIAYFTPYSQQNAVVTEWDTDESSPRYGEPLFYNLKLDHGSSSRTISTSKRVHWTRVIPVVDGNLTGTLNGTPRLKKVWNRLDNLETVVGGGSEAFWKTVFQGVQFDIDKDMDLDDDEKEKLSEQIDEFEHGLRRFFRTRGIKAHALGADVSDFSPQAKTIISLISATTKIPQRMLLGSERGELASTQDAQEWDDRIKNRRSQWANGVVRELVNRLKDYGYLPPVENFFIRWPDIVEMPLVERSKVAVDLSKLNAAMGETVVTGADIRDKILGWEPLDDDVLDRGVLPDPQDDEDADESEGPTA